MLKEDKTAILSLNRGDKIKFNYPDGSIFLGTIMQKFDRSFIVHHDNNAFNFACIIGDDDICLNDEAYPIPLQYN